MDEEFDPSLAPIPEGVLPEVHKLLQDLVETDSEKAFEYLKQDPIAVIALSKILKNIQNFRGEQSKEFVDTYQKYVNEIFSVNHLVKELGLGFTAELLIGYWRKLNQLTHIDSINELIIENLFLLKSKTTLLESNPSNRIIFEIIADGLTRIKGMHNHERSKAEEQLKPLSILLDQFVGEQFIPLPISGIPDVWYSLLAIASMKHGTAMEFRKLLSQIMLKHLKAHFADFIEDQKYVIAPYIALLEKMGKRP